MTNMTAYYEVYTETLDGVGESILVWSDPDKQFRGHTEVRQCVR